MEFTRNTKSYFQAFFFLGLSSLRMENAYNGVFTKLPIIAHALIGLIMATSVMISVSSNRERYYFGRTEVMIINLRASCDIIRTVFTIIQYMFYKRIISEIFKEFQNFESIFAFHFRYQIHYATFNRTFFVKMIMIVAAGLQYICAFVLRAVILKSTTTHGVQFKFTQGLAAVTFLHVIFYIEILSFHLDQLNNVVQRDIQNREKEVSTGFIIRGFQQNIQVRNNINNFKNVHFRLWLLSKKINKYFGWCLIALFLHGFVDFFYSFYWLYIQLQKSLSPLRVIRK